MARVEVRLYLFVLLLALLPRLAFVFYAPSLGGDGFVYFTVAENILLNFCVSLSDPAAAACVPHWGGNQLPGYPAIIALISAFFGSPEMPVQVAQSILAAAAICWLVRALWRYTGSLAVAVIAGLLLALSPLQVAWPRHIMTETLALATTTWVFAELVLSLEAGRLRRWPLAAALLAAIFMRYDGILLCVPTAVCGFILHRPREAFRRGLILALLISLPVAGWLGRNVAVGLSALPTSYQMPDGSPAPNGYLAWIRTWLTSVYPAATAVFPIAHRKYAAISIDAEAFDGADDRTRVLALIDELRSYTGQPFPPHIDAQFKELATARRAAAPLRHWLLNPLRRIAQLWSDPYASFGWPAEIGDARVRDKIRRMIREGGVSGALEAVRQYPGAAIIKGVVSGYRYLLLAVTLLLAALSMGRLIGFPSAVIWLGASYAIARTLFFSYFPESRYLAEAAPGMEMAVATGLILMWRSRKAASTTSLTAR